MLRLAPMVGDFGDIWLKLARAYEHLSELQSSLRWAIESQPNAVQVNLDADETHWEAIMELPDGGDEADPHWNILIGEILYQLQSCLDHLGNALVPQPTNNTGFPIISIETDYSTEAAKKLFGLDPLSMDATIVKLLQPFSIKPAAPKDTTPWALKELARFDRHRALHVSGLVATEDSEIGFDPPGGGTLDWSMQVPGPLEHRAVVARGRIIRTTDQPKVDVRVKVIPDLALTSVDSFRSETPLDAIYVRGLWGIWGFVRRAILALESPQDFLRNPVV